MYCSKPETKLVHAAVINSTFYEKTVLLNLQFSPILIWLKIKCLILDNISQ
jgi:hypothetical protein